MFLSWNKELPDADRDALLKKVAFEIRKRKLEVPAILFLESHRPLSVVGANAGVAFAPFLIPFVGFDNVQNATLLMQDRSNIDRLLDMMNLPLDQLKVDPKESEALPGPSEVKPC